MRTKCFEPLQKQGRGLDLVSMLKTLPLIIFYSLFQCGTSVVVPQCYMCYFRVCMVSSYMTTCITVALFASYLVLIFLIQNRK